MSKCRDAWQQTKGTVYAEVLAVEKEAADRLPSLETRVKDALALGEEGRARALAMINACTTDVYRDAASRWQGLEARFWRQFGMGF